MGIQINIIQGIYIYILYIYVHILYNIYDMTITLDIVSYMLYMPCSNSMDGAETPAIHFQISTQKPANSKKLPHLQGRVPKHFAASKRPPEDNFRTQGPTAHLSSDQNPGMTFH